MRFKKKISLMNPQELWDYRDFLYRRAYKYRPESIKWKYYGRKIARVTKEIHFKDLLLSGLQYIHKD